MHLQWQFWNTVLSVLSSYFYVKQRPEMKWYQWNTKYETCTDFGRLFCFPTFSIGKINDLATSLKANDGRVI